MACSDSFGNLFMGSNFGLYGDTIRNFGGDDRIDIIDLRLASIQPLSFSGLPRELNVSDGSQETWLMLGGGLTANCLIASDDGQGGTLITLAG